MINFKIKELNNGVCKLDVLAGSELTNVCREMLYSAKQFAALQAENDQLKEEREELLDALNKCSVQLANLGYSANHADDMLVKYGRP